MIDHPSLHDPFYYEPLQEDEREEPTMRSIEEMIESGGGAFIYNPNNNEEIFLFERQHDRYWVERWRVKGRRDGNLLVSLIHLLETADTLEELGDLYPEWAEQAVYPKDHLEVV